MVTYKCMNCEKKVKEIVNYSNIRFNKLNNSIREERINKKVKDIMLYNNMRLRQ